ncbi:MAG: class I SAM-dependent methyltransferase [Candidatus Mcinerneyibacterium aminivorans]|uniref:Class I SAM-dependent methyltransferase n=1 Tax=Candidatus Mcinerneyibacterium aminivorans TaxID=2703815 RepID=A0A5D0M9Y7_9BACT|nr:MAG: class I SAM-dependent methyltransferase [Candidatus Mcinerneyibacterium aminivorans]
MKNESSKKISGWGFEYIEKTGRCSEQPLKWGYGSKVIPEIRKANYFLDMGTGGGELLKLFSPFPKYSFATEGYKPNIKIARQNLEKYNVEVKEIRDDSDLGFECNYFDLIINRHESYDPGEVNRILKKDGIFITQQVGSKDCCDLNELLEAPKNQYYSNNWNLDNAVKSLEENGVKIIEKMEDFPKIRFYDTGAIVFFLKTVIWQIPDFSTDQYLDGLKKISKMIKKRGYIEFLQHRFFIKSKKK